MKYFTKEWYNLGQKLISNDDFERLDKETYTDEEIADLYERVKAEFIEEEREYFDTPPVDFRELIRSIDDLELTDVMVADIDEHGIETNVRHPESWEEFEKYQDIQSQVLMEEFESRGDFDLGQAEADFEDFYDMALELDLSSLPAYVLDEVDSRLLALYHLPASVYDRLEADQEKDFEKYETMFEDAVLALEDEYEAIPAEILDHFFLRDGFIDYLQEDGDDILIGLSGVDLDDEYVEMDITFKNAKFIEMDEFDEDSEEDLVFIYHEMYKTPEGYELHILSGQFPELKYVTIGFEDMEVEY